MNETTTEDKDDETVIAYEPDFALKKTIGEDVKMSEIFTPEKIAECQKIIKDASASFFEAAQNDLNKLEEALKNAKIATDNGNAFFEDAGQTATNLKGQAELFGFWLINNSCLQIIACCKSPQDPVSTRMSLIKELFSALHLAIQKRIMDDGGDVGKALLLALDNYRARKKKAKAV